jgi:hypothetical protein
MHESATREDIEKSTLPEAMARLQKRAGALFSWWRALHCWGAHRTGGTWPLGFQSTDIECWAVSEDAPWMPV